MMLLMVVSSSIMFIIDVDDNILYNVDDSVLYNVDTNYKNKCGQLEELLNG